MKSTHDVDPMRDDEIFFYGLDEKQIQDAIESKDSGNDFVITAYREII